MYVLYLSSVKFDSHVARFVLLITWGDTHEISNARNLAPYWILFTTERQLEILILAQ